MIVTKDEMCQAAIELIRESGYEKVTVPSICQTCGVTKGSFYHHFRNKEDLVIYWLSNKVGTTVEIPREEGLSHKERLQKLMHEHALLIASIGCDLFFNAIVADSKNGGQNLLRNMVEVDPVEQLVQQAMDARELQSDAEAGPLLGAYIMAVIGAIVEWKMSNGTSDIVEDLDNLFRLIFR